MSAPASRQGESPPRPQRTNSTSRPPLLPAASTRAVSPFSGLTYTSAKFLTTASSESAAAASELSSIKNAVSFYDSENKRLKSELETADIIIKANAAKLAQQEKLRQALQKKVVVGDKSLRFEKLAGEGMVKKMGYFENEHNRITEEKKILVEEKDMKQQRITFLEKCINEDRSKRLKEIHENEKLGRENANLRSRIAVVEADNVRVNSELLQRFQQTETSVTLSDHQQRTIDAQAEEMVSLAREICNLQEKQQILVNKAVQLEQIAATRSRERDKYESEVKRLRTELLSISLLQGDKTVAYQGAKALSRPRLKAINNASRNTSSSSSQHLDPLNNASGFPSSSSSSQHLQPSTRGDNLSIAVELATIMDPLSEARSTSAKIMRTASRKHRRDPRSADKLVNYAVTAPDSVYSSFMSNPTHVHTLQQTLTHRFSTATDTFNLGARHGYSSPIHSTRPLTQSSSFAESFPANNSSHSTMKSTSAMNPPSPTSMLPYSRYSADERTSNNSMKETRFAVASNEDTAGGEQADNYDIAGLSVKPKSMFVGSGLGLRQPAVPDFNPKGSAKAVLKKIMAQFED